LENPVKKFITALLLGAFVLTTSVSVVGCKDDTKEKKVEKKEEKKETK